MDTGQGGMLLGFCSQSVWDAPVHGNCDTATRVRGADLFKAEWLATVTQLTAPLCTAPDSHLTLLSSEGMHWAERGTWSLCASWIPPLHTQSHPSSPACPTTSHIYIPVGAVGSLFIICFHLMISVILPQEYPYALCKSY